MSHAGRTAPADLGPAPSGEAGGGLDQELVALEAPPQTQRLVTLTVMAAAVVAAMALVFSLAGEMRYAFAPDQPVELGDVRNATAARLHSNTYVHVTGIPTVARAIRFTKGLGTVYRIFPLAGQRNVYVQMQDTGGESFVRSEFTGRLASFEDLGRRYADLAKVMERDTGVAVTSDSFVLLADEPPGDYTWTWLVGLFCVSLVILDAYFIVRWFKPVKWAQES